MRMHQGLASSAEGVGVGKDGVRRSTAGTTTAAPGKTKAKFNVKRRSQPVDAYKFESMAGCRVAFVVRRVLLLHQRLVWGDVGCVPNLFLTTRICTSHCIQQPPNQKLAAATLPHLHTPNPTTTPSIH